MYSNKSGLMSGHFSQFFKDLFTFRVTYTRDPFSNLLCASYQRKKNFLLANYPMNVPTKFGSKLARCGFRKGDLRDNLFVTFLYFLSTKITNILEDNPLNSPTKFLSNWPRLCVFRKEN
jgi:hypothetical protein